MCGIAGLFGTRQAREPARPLVCREVMAVPHRWPEVVPENLDSTNAIAADLIGKQVSSTAVAA